MEIRVLGSIEAWNGEILAIGGPRQRRILAALAMHAGSVVSLDRLVDVTWSGEDPPAQADRNVRTYVHRIRAAVGDEIADRFATAAPGYQLHLEDGELDARRFEDSCARASRLYERGDLEGAGAQVDEALALWRGRPYAEFADEQWAQPEVARLEELRVVALELRAEAMLTLGRSSDVLPALESLIDEHPLRERPRALYMQALYRSGRQAEALRSFQDFRHYLIEEAGVTPSEDLADLDRAIAAGTLEQASASGQIRGYEIHELIGTGAFADVHRGSQPALGRDVAIKVVKPELANRPEFIRGFEAEAAMIARLEHPHIVPLYDFWREPDRACLVMRWLTGGSLESSLDAGPWSVEQAAQMVEQVGSALALAHRAGVVHRDVKSANILLDEERNAYLSDFGIAVEATGEENPAAALSEGSPAFASPEQLRREEVGPAADVHGLGIAVYQALTGRMPFPDAEDKAALLRRQLHDPIPAASASRPGLPAMVDDVLGRATAKDPKARYQDVGEFVEAFVTALADSPSAPASVHEVARRVTEISGAVDNPYRGLQAFGEGDADLFFGRDRLVDELLTELDEGAGNFLAVVGPSGSGKSSVVRAGLVPALRHGRLSGSEDWFITTMTPGARPYESLETALLRIAVNPPATLQAQLREDRRGILRGVRRITPTDQATAVLVIDQFEELFTLCDDDVERRSFLDALTAAATEPGSRLRVVATLRADFYDEPLRYEGFAELLKRHAVTVTPLAADELEQAIVRPAESVGAIFEPGLVAEIVADVASQPGALPLMQYALTELFEARVSGMLMMSAYRELGGLSGALGRRADELFAALGSPEQAAARRVFGRLVTLGDGSEDTRRRVLRGELGDGQPVDAVIDTYGKARLLSFDRDPATREPTVEVAHEALIREWPRLRSWLDEDRDGQRVLRGITEATQRWVAAGREAGDLYRGGRLEAAVEFEAAHDDDLNADERSFLAAAAALRDQEAERTRRTNRRLRRLAVAVSAVAVLALVAGIVAVVQQGEAADQRDAAEVARAEAEANAEQARVSQEAAEESQTEAESSAQEAMAAQELAEANETDARESAIEADAARAAAETSRIAAQAVSVARTDPRVGLLLAAEAYGREESVTTMSSLQRTLLAAGPIVGYVGLPQRKYHDVEWVANDSGSIFVAAHRDGIEVYDGATSELLWSPESPPLLLDRGGRTLRAGAHVAFALSGDGAHAAVAVEEASVALFDISAERTYLLKHAEPVSSLAFSHAGTHIATGDARGVARIWDVSTRTVVQEIVAHPESSSLELNGAFMDAGGFDLEIIEQTNPGAAAITRRGVGRMVFSLDDDFLITAENPIIRVWDVGSGLLDHEFFPLYFNRFIDALGGAFFEADFDLDPADPDVIAAVTRNELLRVNWRDGTVPEFFPMPVNDDTNLAEAGGDLSPDGTWVVGVSDGRVHRLDPDGVSTEVFEPALRRLSALAVSPDGNIAAVAGEAGLALIGLEGNTLLAESVPREPTARRVTISADGSTLAQSSGFGGVTTVHTRLEDGMWVVADALERAASGRLAYVESPRHGRNVLHVWEEETDETEVYDVGSGERLGVIQGIEFGSTYSHDGRWYTVENVGDSIRVFHTETWTEVASVAALEQETLGAAFVRSTSFDHLGQRLIAANQEGTYGIWDTADWALIEDGEDLGLVQLASFSPDGRWLATVDPDGTIAIRDAESFQTIRELTGQNVPNFIGGGLNWSSDGSILLTRFEDEPRLWDVATGLQIGDPFPNDGGAAFYGSILGLKLATAGERHALVWNTDPSTWADVACRAAGRNMTQAEWEQFGPQGEPYRATCPQYPAGA